MLATMKMINSDHYFIEGAFFMWFSELHCQKNEDNNNNKWKKIYKGGS